MDKIMIVDDEKDIIYMIKDFTKIYDIQVIEAFSGEEALEKFDETIKMLIIDINMDGMSGIELCKKIRESSNVPIMFLTCKNSQRDIILGLGVGADDYITKPFDPIELIARAKANIRRYKDYNKVEVVKNDDIISFNNIKVLKNSYKVLKDDVDTNLTAKEFKLLLYLIENAHLVLSRDQILDNVWNNNYYDKNVVTTTVKRLRRKIEDYPDNPSYVKTVWGVGYVFEAKLK
ncbi:response regulator transcription factor [Wukongibacter baidiensis]|uniref:response regulator transcription factor n=1 Tax=Wukongibacter baidiensis TaxID=1723361 RepID=UPI003D7FC361